MKAYALYNPVADGLGARLRNLASRFSMAGEKGNTGIQFQSNGILTLGVEIEFQIIDPQTLSLSPKADELLKKCSHIKKLKPEFFLSTVEINTDKCDTVKQAEQDIRETLSAMVPAADSLGVRFSTTGCHPLSKYADCEIYPTERYLELIDRNQWLTRRMTVYSMHVHLGMESGDECIRFHNFFMHFIPHLLALSASSPYWQGVDTGLASCRPTTYEALPTAGQPYHVNNWREFEYLYHTLKKCHSIQSIKDLWWDMRPSPSYGTLELRVCDGPATLAEAMAITAFVHMLAHWFKDNADWLESFNYPPPWMARENKWRAMRHGMDADLVMNTEGKVKPLRENMEEWFEKLTPYAERFGYQKYLNDLRLILNKGNSSERQRRVFERTGSVEEVVRFNIEEFMKQEPIW